MKKQIFPKEIIENTVEVHQFKHAHKSKIIYGILLISLIAAFVSLPFIKITIYNTSQGLIRPDKERILLQSSTAGKVVFHQLRNNFQVKKGDTLLLMNNLAITQKIQNTKSQLNETKIFINDLELLSNLKTISTKLHALKIKQEYNFYKQKLSELNTRFQKIKEDYNRSLKLFRKGVIPKMELENSTLAYDLALNAIHQYKKQQNSTWQGQLVKHQNQLKELQNNQIQLQENNNLAIIKAPVSGT
jgi:HlyD family secretion protein